MQRVQRTGATTSDPPRRGREGRRLMVRTERLVGAAPADQQLDVAWIGLERPVYDDEVLACVSNAQRAKPGETIPAIHFKHISPTRQRFQTGPSKTVDRRGVDAGEVGDGCVAIERHLGARSDRRDEESLTGVPLYREVLAGRGAESDDSNLIRLGHAIVVEVVPKAEPALVILFLPGIENHVAGIRPRCVLVNR